VKTTRYAGSLTVVLLVAVMLNLEAADDPLRDAVCRDSVVAIVNDEIITALDVIRESQQAEQEIRKNLTREEQVEKIYKLRQAYARELVARELLYAEFVRANLRVPGELVQRETNRFIKDFAGGSRLEYERMLQATGMTLQEHEEKLKRNLAVEIMRERHIRSAVHVSPAQVDEYYQKRRDTTFTIPVEYRVCLIQLNNDGRHAGRVQDVAAEIEKQLKTGSDAAELARKYSDHSSAENGGDQGWRPEAEIRPDVKELTPGGFVRVDLETSVAFLVLSEKRGGTARPLDDTLRREIRTVLRSTEEQRLTALYVKKVRKNHFVKVFFEREDEQ